MPAFNVGPSSTRQQSGISVAFRWRADGGPFIAVFESSIPHQVKNVIKFGPPLTKLSESAHVGVCLVQSGQIIAVTSEFVLRI